MKTAFSTPAKTILKTMMLTMGEFDFDDLFYNNGADNDQGNGTNYYLGSGSDSYTLRTSWIALSCSFISFMDCVCIGDAHRPDKYAGMYSLLIHITNVILIWFIYLFKCPLISNLIKKQLICIGRKSISCAYLQYFYYEQLIILQMFTYSSIHHL